MPWQLHQQSCTCSKQVTSSLYVVHVLKVPHTELMPEVRAHRMNASWVLDLAWTERCLFAGASRLGSVTFRAMVAAAWRGPRPVLLHLLLLLLLLLDAPSAAAAPAAPAAAALPL